MYFQYQTKSSASRLSALVFSLSVLIAPIPHALAQSATGSNEPSIVARDVASNITAVTVYPRSAEVTRTAKVKIRSGENRLTFRDLPPQLVANSLRVEGRASIGLELGPVETRSIRLTTSESDAEAQERKTLEVQLKAAKREAERLRYDLQVKETQRDFLVNLAGLPARTGPAATAGTATGTNWADLFGLIGTNMAAVQTALFELNEKVATNQRLIVDLERQLQRLAPKPRAAVLGTLMVLADGDGEAELTLRYQVGGAGWQPLYDARLNTRTSDGKAALEIVRRASIHQRTSEPWSDVALTLSTVRASGRTSAPDVRTQVVEFQPKRVPVGGGGILSMDSAPVAAARQARSAPRGTGLARKARQQEAQVVIGSFQAEYRIVTATTVENTGARKSVIIDRQVVAPKLNVRAVPRMDLRAYLYAAFDLPAGTPYLSGQISLFRDGTFVGRGRMPELPGGEKFELGFGADDLVKVTFDIRNDQRGETGIISTSKTDTRSFRVTITNNHSSAVRYTIVDRLPVSRDDEIKVETLRGNQPTRRNLDGQRGVMAWDGDLAASKKTELRFGYRITWPAGREIRYR